MKSRINSIVSLLPSIDLPEFALWDRQKLIQIFNKFNGQIQFFVDGL